MLVPGHLELLKYCPIYSDIEIVKTFSLRPTKLAHLICFGITPFVEKKLIDQV